MHIGYARRLTRAIDGRGLAPQKTRGLVGRSILQFPSTHRAWSRWNSYPFRIGKQVPGPVTKRLLGICSARVEVDIVEQALSHLDATERQTLEERIG